MKSCRCIVKGRVQGVWFRRFTKNIADELGISGYVKNLPDGSVEVEATMEDEKFAPFLEALHQGPPLARVDEVEVEEIDRAYSGGFEIVR